MAGDALYFHTDLLLNFGFGSETMTDVNGENKADINSMLIGLRPGWDYFIGDKWAIELNWGFLGYNSRTTDYGNDNTNTVSGFTLDVDFTTIGLGARWYF